MSKAGNLLKIIYIGSLIYTALSTKLTTDK